MDIYEFRYEKEDTKILKRIEYTNKINIAYIEIIEIKVNDKWEVRQIVIPIYEQDFKSLINIYKMKKI